MCGFWVFKHIHNHIWIAQNRWQFYGPLAFFSFRPKQLFYWAHIGRISRPKDERIRNGVESKTRIFITLFFTHNQTQTNEKNLSSLVTFSWVTNTPFQIKFSGQHPNQQIRVGVSLILAVQENTRCQCYFQTRKTQHASFHSNCESTKTPRILRFFAFYTESTKLHFTRSNVLSNYYGF